MPQFTDDTEMFEVAEPSPPRLVPSSLALEFVEVGQNEDGEYVILLTGSFAAVQAAGKLFGQPVVLVPADQKGGAA